MDDNEFQQQELFETEKYISKKKQKREPLLLILFFYHLFLQAQ